MLGLHNCETLEYEIDEVKNITYTSDESDTESEHESDDDGFIVDDNTQH